MSETNATWPSRTCSHPEFFQNLPPTTFATACRCGQNYACPTCGFGSMCHPHTCPDDVIFEGTMTIDVSKLPEFEPTIREPHSHAEFARFVQEAKEQRARADALAVENAALREGIEKLKRRHLEVEDAWYSCPKSEERGGSCLKCDVDGDCGCGCTCGADFDNAQIDAILASTALARQGAGEGG